MDIMPARLPGGFHGPRERPDRLGVELAPLLEDDLADELVDLHVLLEDVALVVQPEPVGPELVAGLAEDLDLPGGLRLGAGGGLFAPDDGGVELGELDLVVLVEG